MEVRRFRLQLEWKPHPSPRLAAETANSDIYRNWRVSLCDLPTPLQIPALMESRSCLSVAVIIS